MWLETRSLVMLWAATVLIGCGATTVPDAGVVDALAPTIHSTSPSGGSTEERLDISLLVAFSEPMDPATVSVTSAPPLSNPDLVWDQDHTNLTVVVQEAFAPDTLYTVTVAGRDLAGNPLTGLAAFSFTTMKIDTIAPMLASTAPIGDMRGVATDSAVTLTFSERMSVGSVAVEVYPAVDLGAPAWVSSTALRFAPPAGFAPSTRYEFAVRGTDLAGNDLAGPTTFAFTTGAPPDLTPPTVSDTAPAHGETGVSNNALITLQFSESMRPDDTTAALSLRLGTTPIEACAAHWVWNTARTLVWCRPSPSLAFNTVYSLIVDVGAKDVAGNALEAPFGFSFTTGPTPDTLAPRVMQVTPRGASIGVDRDAYAEITFSESMDTATTEEDFNCMVGDARVGGTLTWLTRNKVLRFTPAISFAPGVTVRCQVRGGAATAQDIAGNRLGEDFSWSFRVLRAASLVAPAIGPLEGHVYNSGVAWPALTFTYVGDTSLNLASRGFFAFSLAGLPEGTARVTSAVLSLYFIGPLGVPGSLGDLTVDHVDYGPVLSGSDFDVAPLQGTVWNTPTTTGFRALSVVNLVQDDFLNRVARGNRSEFRLRFSTDVSADLGFDGLNIASAEWTLGAQRPVIIVGYEYP